MTSSVLGVDGCRGGWVGVAWDGTNVGIPVFGADIESVVRDAATASGAEPAVVGVDIPIGLPDHGHRQADLGARAALGRRGSTVFATPVRQALMAPTFATALATNRKLTGTGISAQSYALRDKILEVDSWRRTTSLRLVEVHPELSFAAMAGEPLVESKKTWAGMIRRRRVLETHGLDLPDDAGIAGRHAGVDDLLDAAAAAWSAMRVLGGTAESIPPVPECFEDGFPAAIWR